MSVCKNYRKGLPWHSKRTVQGWLNEVEAKRERSRKRTLNGLNKEAKRRHRVHFFILHGCTLDSKKGRLLRCNVRNTISRCTTEQQSPPTTSA